MLNEILMEKCASVFRKEAGLNIDKLVKAHELSRDFRNAVKVSNKANIYESYNAWNNKVSKGEELATALGEAGVHRAHVRSLDANANDGGFANDLLNTFHDPIYNEYARKRNLFGRNSH